jgi:hypothetical protein
VRNVPNDAISLLETQDIWSDFVYLTGDIASEHSGPLLHKDTEVQHVAVKRVDSYGGVFDDELAGACGRHGSITDTQRGASFVEPCGLVLGRGHGFEVGLGGRRLV